jgi:hypothetical protein
MAGDEMLGKAETPTVHHAGGFVYVGDVHLD